MLATPLFFWLTYMSHLSRDEHFLGRTYIHCLLLFFSVPTLDWWLAVLSLPWSLDHFLLVIKIQNWLSLIFNRYKSIKLCWVPCYVSVASNDHAYCWGGGIPPPNVPVPFPRNGFLPCHSQMDPHYWRDKGLCITGY